MLARNSGKRGEGRIDEAWKAREGSETILHDIVINGEYVSCICQKLYNTPSKD